MILVTGSTGFLGSYLVRYLVRDGLHVRALKRPTSDLSLLAEAKDKVEWVEGDVTDIPALEDAFKGIEKVYHAASVVALEAPGRKRMLKVNVEGTANVVNVALAKGVKKLLYVSSSSALRMPAGGGWIDEHTEPEKNGLDSDYGISKFLGEREVWRGMAEGLKAVVVNPTVLLGAGRWAETSARIFGAVAKGQLFYPTGSTGYTDVRDAAKIIIRLMESDISGERFIINAENRLYRDVINEIADGLGVRRPPFPLNRWLIPLGKSFDWMRSGLTHSQRVLTSDVARITLRMTRFDNTKIKTALNFSFIPISKTITETVEHYKKSMREKRDYAVMPL
ncbi:MAG TPA: NAD-dependent epimerase/dehydratase family protein [Chitinophagales bacterium]|nr:NAD-dependent epimerase/dehydratase family protein [Chitinophagales bacterium]